MPHSSSDLLSVLTLASVGMQARAPVVAAILEVAAHPSTDRLRVCTVDIGADQPVSVVTNAPDAAAGRRVFVAVRLMICRAG